MTKEEDESKEILSVPKKDKPDDINAEESKKNEDKSQDTAHDDRGDGSPPPPPASSYPPQQGYYQPPPKPPMFTPEGFPRILAFGLLIGIILLFVGSMIFVSAAYMDPDEEDNADKRDDAYDFQRNLYASSRLFGAIGLLLTGIFVILPLVLIKGLSTNQRFMLIVIISAIIIGFTQMLLL